MKTTTQKLTARTSDCQNLLHAIRLTSAYVQPQIRTCVDCGAEVLLDIQVYPVWLTEALQDVVLDERGQPVMNYQTGKPMTVYGIGYAEDLRGRNRERLESVLRAHRPGFGGEGSNTQNDTEE